MADEKEAKPPRPPPEGRRRRPPLRRPLPRRRAAKAAGQGCRREGRCREEGAAAKAAAPRLPLPRPRPPLPRLRSPPRRLAAKKAEAAETREHVLKVHHLRPAAGSKKDQDPRRTR